MRFHQVDASSLTPSELHLFVSYEERTVGVASQLERASSLERVMGFYCDDRPSARLSENMGRLKGLFGDRFTPVPVSWSDPTPILRAVSSGKAARSVVVDITCFTRENLFAYLWSSRCGRGAESAFVFGYTPARSYGPWLSRDFGVAHNMVGFGGSPIFANRRDLICLVGFESDRARALIKELEPSSVLLAVGTNPTKEEFDQRNRVEITAVMGWEGYDICEIGVGNPQQTLDDLRAIVRQRDLSGSLHLAPFNTKVSCLGVFGLWLEMPQMRVWNVQPATYNVRGYSTGSEVSRFYEAVP
jgi:hypothetical protein